MSILNFICLQCDLFDSCWSINSFLGNFGIWRDFWNLVGNSAIFMKRFSFKKIVRKFICFLGRKHFFSPGQMWNSKLALSCKYWTSMNFSSFSNSPVFSHYASDTIPKSSHNWLQAKTDPHKATKNKNKNKTKQKTKQKKKNLFCGCHQPKFSILAEFWFFFFFFNFSKIL